ncbi:ATP phosphoribosyltransferase [Nocardia farcinica]|uniref:ATP phosphoribosyltransferase n=2 Tax=Nocardia farcinica TaxID=37329 RepID=HIS1_NOCFA|nr:MULTISPECIES: ATP phosphoribosyltransferase [Nocardia]Q5YUV9.1 RecName: Full=ATP phosphoribosyltransferase; Short=ATP-PRT; Short=ATP-PRTase [Nocardia farcinica IFM 10152]AXK84398.1 ATP phosphoribosyltransferase [Nocardia farcinica]MBA4856356.1 ATP phosphoribosyltransferase [Nocardia farcinica]MBC9814182.1 ATP phosphoribosyltransferase [Nocardia farcinica]MBF6183752.1 ATP phosphoribosyltransferase [Nocardia farcinica]MBF6232889.1 ATP phosphoribosyltransferase [Nocardia farcinica]
MLRVAVPNKGALSESATSILSEAGYRKRTDSRDLSVLDPENQVEFYFLRPKDIAVYVGSGELDLGITGRDLALDSGAPVQERLALGFGRSTFRYAAPAGREWKVEDLYDKRIATSYPNLVLSDLRRRGIEAEVIRLDGAVEISIQLGVADAIADVVGSGRTLRQHNLVAFGETLCDSEGVLVERVGADRDDRARNQLVARIQGVVFAQQYLMLDYDCPKELLDQAVQITPGLESPTVSPLADEGWVAVRALVPRGKGNSVMDRLADLGAKAILATDIRSCRAF